MLSRPLTYIINRETRRTQARARVSGKPPTRPGVERDKTGNDGIRYESERHVYETNARFIHVPWRSCPVYSTRFSYGDAETNGRYRLLEQMIWKTPSVHRSPLRNTYPEAVTRAKALPLRVRHMRSPVVWARGRCVFRLAVHDGIFTKVNPFDGSFPGFPVLNGRFRELPALRTFDWVTR